MKRLHSRSSRVALLVMLALLAILALLIFLSSPGRAGVSDVPASLRQQAVRACTADALRLCPETLPDEQNTIACMAGKRAQLGPASGGLYDRVVRLLKR